MLISGYFGRRVLISGFYPTYRQQSYSMNYVPAATPARATVLGATKITRSSNVHKDATQLTGGHSSQDTRRTYTRRSSSMSTCAVAARDGLLRLVEVR